MSDLIFMRQKKEPFIALSNIDNIGGIKSNLITINYQSKQTR